MDVVKKLWLIVIKKYWKDTGQIEIELDWLYDWIPALTIFMGYLQGVYDNRKIDQNMIFRQNIEPE